jgi:hypothetical protein
LAPHAALAASSAGRVALNSLNLREILPVGTKGAMNRSGARRPDGLTPFNYNLQEVLVMRKSLQLIAGAAITAFAGLALAQISPPPPSSPPSSTSPSSGSSSGGGDVFTKLDADKDGMVSKKEASKNKDLTAKWDTLDTNKDGKLDQGEFAAFETTGSSPAPKY